MGEALTECDAGHQRPMPEAKASKACAAAAATRTVLRTGATEIVRFIPGFLCALGVGRVRRAELGLERRERVRPRLVQPFAQRPQAMRVDVVDAARALGTVGDEAGL